MSAQMSGLGCRHRLPAVLLCLALQAFRPDGVAQPTYVTRMIADECNRQGVALGFCFSPDDFWFIHQQGLMITRRPPAGAETDRPETRNRFLLSHH